MRRRPRDSVTWDASSPDEDLVGWAQRGEREAFGLLFDRHFDSVYGYCYRRLGEREAAQDAAAETFRKALTALPGYRPGAFRGCLFTIARNVLADAARRHRPALPLEAAANVAANGETIEEIAIAHSELASVISLLPRLTPDQHEIVALRLTGLSSAEIATVLGKSRGAVGMTLHRALLRLRELLLTAPPVVTGGEGHD
jgi:RNA polymerase sigma-70 factor (ECF subfamily)